MDDNRSREALAEFLDYLAEKGLMAKATVQARKAAASQILGILDESEASDVTLVNVDDLVERFGRLHGRRYTPQSLATYKSRLNAALEDFKSFSKNPLGFRPSVQNRGKTRSKGANNSATNSEPNAPTQREQPRVNPPPMTSSSILPIPIRTDLTVYIQGLPFDLSEAEARRIAAVVTAMAT